MISSSSDWSSWRSSYRPHSALTSYVSVSSKFVLLRGDNRLEKFSLSYTALNSSEYWNSRPLLWSKSYSARAALKVKQRDMGFWWAELGEMMLPLTPLIIWPTLGGLKLLQSTVCNWRYCNDLLFLVSCLWLLGTPLWWLDLRDAIPSESSKFELFAFISGFVCRLPHISSNGVSLGS